MSFTRIARHLISPHWIAYRALPRATLARIEEAIRVSETTHDGELRFAAEAGLHLWPMLRGQGARERAQEVFSRLRVWDTEHNSGVLIYLQLVDRKIEIVADRGINARVGQGEWDAIVQRMESAFRAGSFEQGALDGIREISALLARHFPPRSRNPNELPDRPMILG